MITSKQNETVKYARKLQRKKYRKQENALLIEGPHLLKEARRHGMLKQSFHTETSPQFEDGLLISRDVMKHITASAHPPKDIGIASMPAQGKVGKKVLILENIQDPGNVGTLIRSALAFGFDSIIIDESADVFAPKVLRSTQGAIFHIGFTFMDTVTFKENHPGHLLIGAHLSDTVPLKKQPTPPYALVLGNEGSGLKQSTIARLDASVSIPIGTIDSLNVAVAGSIIMHALYASKPLLG